jgi:hypothetical protein
MARPWIGRIGKAAIPIVIVIVAAAAPLWATTVLWGSWWSQLEPRALLAIAVLAAMPVAALLAAIWWLWWRLPGWQVARLSLKIRDPKARADVEDNFRKTVGQALGGAAVLIGAVAAYLQFTQQQQAARERLTTENFSKAIEQLGSDKLEVRLGGIYALERISKESPQDHWTVMENLTAFVREGTQRTAANPEQRRTQRIEERALALREKAGRPERRPDEFLREAAK